MDELHKVYIRVDLSPSSHFGLHDPVKLIDEITKEISQYFKSNAVNFEVKPIFEGGGGGGVESFIEAFRYLFTHKEVITFFLALIKFIFSLPQYLKRIFVKVHHDTRPRITINLDLGTRANIDEEAFYPIDFMVIDQLINLKNIGDDIHKLITNNRPSFLVDIQFSVSIYKKEFKAVYLLKHEQRNEFNSFRLINFIKAFKIIENKEWFYEFYGFSKLFLSSRTDFCIEYNHEQDYFRGRVGKTKKYYFLLSSKEI